MGNGRTLITGSSAGIGAALADVCAEHGHDLDSGGAAPRTSSSRARRTSNSRFRVKVACVPEDLADPHGPRRVFDAVAAQGLEVEHLINNAGVGLYGKFAVTDLDAELKMIQLNVTSVVELTKRFLPAMIQRRSGKILNVASTAAFVPGPWMSIYYATKAFVLSFSEAIDYELKPPGITRHHAVPGTHGVRIQSARRLAAVAAVRGVPDGRAHSGARGL